MLLFGICLEETTMVVGAEYRNKGDKKEQMTRICSSHYTLYTQSLSWVWWHTQLIPSLQRVRQPSLHSESQLSQDYIADLIPTATITNQQTKAHVCSLVLPWVHV